MLEIQMETANWIAAYNQIINMDPLILRRSIHDIATPEIMVNCKTTYPYRVGIAETESLHISYQTAFKPG
jgi:hypothetical protein